MLSQISLIIPSYNRQNFLLRTIRYWSGSQIQVYILDGSPNPIPPDKLIPFEKNINYLHMPVSLEKRLFAGINHVITDYCVMQGDDEYHLASALEACSEELNSEMDLAACSGRAIGFKCHNNKIVACDIYPEMANFEVMQNAPAERVIENFNPYRVTAFYSVFRTNILKKALECMSKMSFPFYNFQEIQLEIVTKYQGKFKVIPHLMWMRSKETLSIRDTENKPIRPYSHFVELWWPNPFSKNERKQFTQVISTTLAKSTIEQDFIKYVVIQAMDKLVNGQKLSYQQILIFSILEVLPSSVRNLIKSKLTHNFWLSRFFYSLVQKDTSNQPLIFYRDFFDQLSLLDSQGVAVKHIDAEKVFKSLASFYCIV